MGQQHPLLMANLMIVLSLSLVSSGFTWPLPQSPFFRFKSFKVLSQTGKTSPLTLAKPHTSSVTLKEDVEKDEDDEQSLPTEELLITTEERLEEIVKEAEESEEKDILTDAVNDGLVILEPVSEGPIIEVSEHSQMDGMNIVDFSE